MTFRLGLCGGFCLGLQPMTVYHLDEIAGDVRIALDQNTTSDVLKEIGDVDTLALNDIIKSKIIEAVKRVHSSAPPYLLDGGHNFGAAPMRSRTRRRIGRNVKVVGCYCRRILCVLLFSR